MANRVTAAEVKEIISTDLDNDTVDVFIGAANLTVTEIIGDDTSLSDDQKKEVERWLSAHLIACTRQQQPQRQAVDAANIVYQGKTGMGLDATFYGQQVKILDTSGKMAAKLSKKAVSVHAVTTKPSSEWGT